MDAQQSAVSKNAKRRAAKKSKDAEAAAEAPETSKGVAGAMAKSQPQPKAEPMVEVPSVAQPKGKAVVPKGKAKAAAKAASKLEEPKGAPEPVDPFFRLDDGTGGEWEVSTGASKKQARRLERNEERKMLEAVLQGDAQAPTAAVALQNKMVVGNTPAPLLSKPSVGEKVANVGVSAEASVEKGDSTVDKTPLASVTITVPENRIGIVIGPKGAKIKLIQEKTGVNRIDTTGGIFTITGEASKVAQAELAIRDIIDKGYTSLAFDDFQENFVQVHPSSIASIIGDKGVIIRKMKDELGVEVSMPQVPKTTKSSKKYKIMIAGSAEKVEKAKATINNIVMYYHDEVTHPGEVHEECVVEEWMYSYIIGKGGSEMKHIQRNYKVKMYIPREFSANQNVVIVGERNDVDRAKAYVEKVLWKAVNEPRGREKVDDGDTWGNEETEPWMEQYMYKR